MRLLTDGQVVADYKVERFLGAGAFAEVYRVKHMFLQRRRAMKVFKRVGTRTEASSLLEEAKTLSQLDHPNIVRVYEVSTVQTSEGMCAYFVMDYVPGGNLYDFWKRFGARLVPVDLTVNIVYQICSGLAVAHQTHLIHRDVTPMNILVDGGGRALVSDFGLAKRADPLTGLVSAKGNLAFKAPEALQDMRADSMASDVWAIGTIAYLMLTDRLPWEDAGGPSSLFGAAYQNPPEAPSQLNYEVDHELERIVLRTLNVEPEVRTPDAGTLKEELAEWLARRKQYGPSGVDPAGGATTAPPGSGDDEPPEHNPEEDNEALRKALELGRQASTLTEAAALLEQAISQQPKLRAKYGSTLMLWRKGVLA
jgi:serine/threonine protein kinase